jgi:hypothetical protein
VIEKLDVKRGRHHPPRPRRYLLHAVPGLLSRGRKERVPRYRSTLKRGETAMTEANELPPNLEALSEREATHLLTELASDLSPEKEYALRHPEDYVMEMPQSGERIKGRENIGRSRRHSPSHLPCRAFGCAGPSFGRACGSRSR